MRSICSLNISKRSSELEERWKKKTLDYRDKPIKQQLGNTHRHTDAKIVSRGVDCKAKKESEGENRGERVCKDHSKEKCKGKSGSKRGWMVQEDNNAHQWREDRG